MWKQTYATLEKDTGQYLYGFSVGKKFLNKAKKAKGRKKTTNQFYSTKG